MGGKLGDKSVVAGAEGFKPPTFGFGDRRSIAELRPYDEKGKNKLLYSQDILTKLLLYKRLLYLSMLNDNIAMHILNILSQRLQNQPKNLFRSKDIMINLIMIFTSQIQNTPTPILTNFYLTLGICLLVAIYLRMIHLLSLDIYFLDTCFCGFCLLPFFLLFFYYFTHMFLILYCFL